MHACFHVLQAEETNANLLCRFLSAPAGRADQQCKDGRNATVSVPLPLPLTMASKAATWAGLFIFAGMFAASKAEKADRFLYKQYNIDTFRYLTYACM